MPDYSPLFRAAQGAEQRSFKNWNARMDFQDEAYDAELEIKKQMKEVRDALYEVERMPVMGDQAVSMKKKQIDAYKKQLEYLKDQMDQLTKRKSDAFYSYSQFPDFG